MRFTKTCDAILPADAEAVEFFVALPDGAELDVSAVPNQRTAKQNDAIHRWLREVSRRLNEAGYDMRSFPFKDGIELPWSLETAKEFLWMPVQRAICRDEKGGVVRRTRDLSTKQVDEVYGPLSRKILQMGVDVPPLGREL